MLRLCFHGASKFSVGPRDDGGDDDDDGGGGGDDDGVGDDDDDDDGDGRMNMIQMTMLPSEGIVMGGNNGEG